MSFNETKQHGTEDFPIELYHLDRNHPKYEMNFHWHSAIEIIHVHTGKLSLLLNGESVIMSAGDTVFVNSETVHGGTPDNCVYDCIVFHPEGFEQSDPAIKEFTESLLNKAVLIKEHICKDDCPEIENAVSELIKELTELKDGYKFAVLSILYRIYMLVLRKKLIYHNLIIAPKRNMEKLKIILSFIRENYNLPLSLEEISSKVGMSPKYFCRFFKQHTDKTPFEYITAYRIERAARKLISSCQSITQISLACGFTDSSYFTKRFRKQLGLTPREFRKNNLKT